MKIRKININILRAILILAVCTTGNAQGFIDLESGPVFNGYNNVQIPRDTGTKFSLTKDLKTESALFYRIRLGYQIGPKHTVSVLLAPLSLNASGRINQSVRFFEADFPADIPLNAVYRFNSYRLTYRYELIRRETLKLGIGFTAKIRDAAVSVEGNGQKSKKTNIGFVPLLNFRMEWFFSKPFSFLLRGDALAAPQGRAEDVLLALRVYLNENIALKAGYRILEGGADVEEVYNFALIHFIVAGLTFRF